MSKDTRSAVINSYTAQALPVAECPYLDQRLSDTKPSFFYFFSIRDTFYVYNCFQLLTWMITEIILDSINL